MLTSLDLFKYQVCLRTRASHKSRAGHDLLYGSTQGSALSVLVIAITMSYLYMLIIGMYNMDKDTYMTQGRANNFKNGTSEFDL